MRYEVKLRCMPWERHSENWLQSGAPFFGNWHHVGWWKSFIFNDNIPNLIQGVGGAVIAIMTAFLFAVFAEAYNKTSLATEPHNADGSEKQTNDEVKNDIRGLDVRVMMESIIRIKWLTVWVVAYFVLPIFWSEKCELFNGFILICCAFLLTRMVFTLYGAFDWVKGIKWKYRLEYLENHVDDARVWRAVLGNCYRNYDLCDAVMKSYFKALEKAKETNPGKLATLVWALGAIDGENMCRCLEIRKPESNRLPRLIEICSADNGAFIVLSNTNNPLAALHEYLFSDRQEYALEKYMEILARCFFDETMDDNRKGLVTILVIDLISSAISSEESLRKFNSILRKYSNINTIPEDKIGSNDDGFKSEQAHKIIMAFGEVKDAK